MLAAARVRWVLLAIVTLVQTTWSHSALATTTQVTINHSTESLSVEGLLELNPNDKIEFKIVETIKACFLYNADPVAQTPPATFQTHGRTALPATDVVTITTTHQRRVAKYKIEITPRPGADAEGCKALRPLTKEISVATLGWEVGVAGAFTVDGLRSPKYFLAPQGTNPETYAVTRNRGAEDSTNTNLAIMIHVFNTSWNGWHSLEWAPISFGVGFSDTTRYMAGTSLKLGDVFFLTGGYLIGKVDRLPTGLQEGMITTDANAINSTNQKNDTSWFVGFSYQFGSTEATKRLKAIFGSDTDRPAEPK